MVENSPTRLNEADARQEAEAYESWQHFQARIDAHNQGPVRQAEVLGDNGKGTGRYLVAGVSLSARELNDLQQAADNARRRAIRRGMPKSMFETEQAGVEPSDVLKDDSGEIEQTQADRLADVFARAAENGLSPADYMKEVLVGADVEKPDRQAVFELLAGAQDAALHRELLVASKATLEALGTRAGQFDRKVMPFAETMKREFSSLQNIYKQKISALIARGGIGQAIRVIESEVTGNFRRAAKRANDYATHYEQWAEACGEDVTILIEKHESVADHKRGLDAAKAEINDDDQTEARDLTDAFSPEVIELVGHEIQNYLSYSTNLTGSIAKLLESYAQAVPENEKKKIRAIAGTAAALKMSFRDSPQTLKQKILSANTAIGRNLYEQQVSLAHLTRLTPEKRLLSGIVDEHARPLERLIKAADDAQTISVSFARIRLLNELKRLQQL